MKSLQILSNLMNFIISPYVPCNILWSVFADFCLLVVLLVCWPFYNNLCDQNKCTSGGCDITKQRWNGWLLLAVLQLIWICRLNRRWIHSIVAHCERYQSKTALQPWLLIGWRTEFILFRQQKLFLLLDYGFHGICLSGHWKPSGLSLLSSCQAQNSCLGFDYYYRSVEKISILHIHGFE